MTRRSVLQLGAGALFQVGRSYAAQPRQARIVEVRHAFEEFRYRTPYKFGASVVDRVTLLNVHTTLELPNGRRAAGFGSMSMGNMWAWPSRKLSYEQTLGAMQELAGRIRGLTAAYTESGHPVDLNWALEPQYLQAAAAINAGEPVPKLATLVVASPFDAAIHDAYGKLFGVSSWRTYGPQFMAHDLSRYLGPEFRGEWLERYVLTKPVPRIHLFHSVGALDPIEASDVKQRLDDGLPETLPEWISYNGLRRLKIKLTGDDMAWDAERTLRIDACARREMPQHGVNDWAYCLDFNERCPNVEALLKFIDTIEQRSPDGWRRVQYIEQPTKRDLRADRANQMHAAAKRKPVVIDESLTDQETLMLAREMGYSGAALKACKGQTQAALMGAVAQKHRMFLCVQDLTCPGASLVHSASLASHVPGIAGLEANARQYVPAANAPWETRFPGLFRMKDGYLHTAGLTKPGLGVV